MTDRYDRIPDIALDCTVTGGAVAGDSGRDMGVRPRRVGSQLVISGRGEMKARVRWLCRWAQVVTRRWRALETRYPAPVGIRVTGW